MERLLYDNTATGIESAVAEVFGRLLNLGLPLLTHYHSDLYHDALWLQEHLKGPSMVFFFGIRPTGTSIGRDVKLVRGYNTIAYRVTVTCDGGAISMGVENLADIPRGWESVTA